MKITEENNKLIAVFMGIKHITTEAQFLAWEYPGGKEYAKTNSHPEDLHVLESFKYHKSWDHLIPFYSKLMHEVTIVANNNSIELYLDFEREIHAIEDSFGQNDIDTATANMIVLLEWYNENKGL